MKTYISIIAVVCALGGTAFAQDLDEPTDTSTESTTDVSGEASASVGGDASATTDTSMTAGGSGPGSYKMAIGASLNTTADLGAAHLLWALGANYLDVAVGFNLDLISPDEGDSATDIVFDLAVGYRLYKAMSNRIHPYLEPYGRFTLSQLDSAPETAPEAGLTRFGAGAMLGVDFQLFDQFTLGTALGAELDFSLIDGNDTVQGANVLSFGLYTAAINATFWW